MNKGPEELLIAFLSTKKASQKNVPKKKQKERGWDEGNDFALGKGYD